METSLTWLGRLVVSPSSDDWLRLTEIYTPLLTMWANRAGVRPSDRDDLVQEVFVVVLRRVAEFQHEHPGAFRGWLRAILANHLKKYFRDLPSGRCEIDLDDLVAPKGSLSQLFDREHVDQMVRRVMGIVEKDFTSPTWSAFREQVLENRRPQEVADQLNLSLNAVVKAKCRVLKRLREELDGWIE